jgi:hypothetical protein
MRLHTKYLMANLEQQSYLVIPDSHGEYEKIARVVDEHEQDVDMFLFLGDVIDGPDSFRLVKLIRDLGNKALTIVGNHEWTLRNALTVGEEPAIEIWRTEIWPGYEDRMLESYRLNRSPNWQTNAIRLREAMVESGDLDWLNSLPPYFENGDFIAVHAGPELDHPWQNQRIYLDRASSDEARLIEEPDQIFSHRLANVTDIPRSVDNRTFVSGHYHLFLPAEKRTARQRVCLASNLAAGAPLFVWHSVNNSIHLSSEN